MFCRLKRFCIFVGSKGTNKLIKIKQNAQNQQVMKNLITILKNQTETLKVQFVAMSKDYAEKEFNRFKNMTSEEFVQLYGKYGWSYLLKKNVKQHTRASYARWNKIQNQIFKGLELYVETAEKNAVDHYERSIEKLAFRIQAKGLNEELLEVVTSHVGVNIETTLTDGNKTVRAFTIIASGDIQKPHYRYLIK